MTRRIDIVNLSNWDGEDYDVYDAVTSHRLARLKPGESLMLSTWSNDQAALPIVVPVTSKTPEPFVDDDGKQVFPTMELGFE